MMMPSGMANKIAMLVSEARNKNAEQKDSLFKSNKEMKVTMWHWKQQLFADTSTVVVPLSTLKAIYGEVTTNTQSGETVKEESRMSTTSRIMV
ncbi:uncharacterized protein BNAC06G01780D isoform X3 [Brassica napus]|uniref:uncharacterized protein LOC106298983 isoform X3 n=1 Tax=Brassica oleracea var. oleracea TaxID=109376 RepID=UPI0006A71D9F|nr:PREDICTED: uncharacterized protein LOC106298983 isoform X3 [Brassica oleracea var. oleracea]XP_013699266.1 uncharacterized protein BNAC06G01780D isoform X3 [Brassica napus]XP_022559892.1 uncharacterized protein BNAC06G01780D isoform X3 [Brassica napus]